MKAAVSDIHFYDLEIPELLLKAIKLKSSKPFSIVDLRYGDARILFDDKELVREIVRLLKPGGLAYVSSVIKSKGAIWLYRWAGSFRSSPDHIREYSSTTDFVGVLDHYLRVVELKISRFKFPLIHLLLRLMIKARLLSPQKARWLPLKSPIRTSISPPGYFIVECLVTKQSCAHQ